MKNKLNSAGPFVSRPSPQSDDALTVKIYFSARDGRQPHYRPSQSGFAAARFPDEPEHIAAIEIKTKTVNGFDRGVMLHQKTFPDGKVHVQILDPQQRMIAG